MITGKNIAVPASRESPLPILAAEPSPPSKQSAKARGKVPSPRAHPLFRAADFVVGQVDVYKRQTYECARALMTFF